MKDHSTQNAYLQGCVQVKSADKIRRRPRKENAKQRNSFSYSVTIERKTIYVCQAAFLGLHGIKESRLKRKVLNFNVSILDGRGSHENHATVDEGIKNRVREHIKLHSARESHYSRTQNKHKKYLDASLSVAKLHRDFIEANPELRYACKYSLYYSIFNYEFNIGFGYPRSDICDLCEKLNVDVKRAQIASDERLQKKLTQKIELHHRKADVFTLQMQEATENAKTCKDSAVIAMDYQKNLPLPLTGISKEYYKRQLWLHNFCIHNTVQEQATMFVYSKSYAGKGPNEVLSCLDFYIRSLPVEITKLYIFADNCFSQNKNRYIIAYLYAIANSILDEVHVFYPLPGHSRMPCDRDFGRIERNRRKKDKVTVPSQWVELIRKTDQINPFRVVFVEHPLTDDLKQDSTPVVKVKDFKACFDPCLRPPKNIAAVRGLLFKLGEQPSSRFSMTGECGTPIAILKRGKKIKSIIDMIGAGSVLRNAYTTFLSIKRAKLLDVKHLLDYVFLPDHVTFYATLRDSETTQESDEEDLEYC